MRDGADVGLSRSRPIVLSDTGCHALANERVVRMTCSSWLDILINSDNVWSTDILELKPSPRRGDDVRF